MIAIYSGTSAPRVYVDEPPREPTRQFRAPVFDHTREEFSARMYLMSRHLGRSPVARARLKTLEQLYSHGKERQMLDAFDAQNREALGLEGL